MAKGSNHGFWLTVYIISGITGLFVLLFLFYWFNAKKKWKKERDRLYAVSSSDENPYRSDSSGSELNTDKEADNIVDEVLSSDEYATQV